MREPPLRCHKHIFKRFRTELVKTEPNWMRLDWIGLDWLSAKLNTLDWIGWAPQLNTLDWIGWAPRKWAFVGLDWIGSEVWLELAEVGCSFEQLWFRTYGWCDQWHAPHDRDASPLLSVKLWKRERRYLERKERGDRYLFHYRGGWGLFHRRGLGQQWR